MDLRGVRCRTVRLKDGLHLVPGFGFDDRLVESSVGGAFELHKSPVVRVGQHPVHRGFRDRALRLLRRRRYRQSASNEFSVQLGGRPMPRREHGECPHHQLSPSGVDLDGAGLAAHPVAHADIAVANRRPVHRAAAGSLLCHALHHLG